MRTQAIGGLLCFILSASFAVGGGTPKDYPFVELATSDLDALMGDWEAGINTKNGWKGTLRANVTLKRNHPEVSYFHAILDLRYDVKFVDVRIDKKTGKKTTEVVSVNGSEKRAMIPFQKDKQCSVQFLRDFQLLHKEYLLELLDFRPEDKAAQKALAAMHPTGADTAPYAIANGTWTLAMAPALAEILPRQSKSGPRIDWDSTIVWTKVKSK